jgi:hypothetical protein
VESLVSLPALLAAVAGSSAESLFVVREVNQLLVAAIACLTACRPLSSFPFGAGVAMSGWPPSSTEPGRSGASAASAAELFDLPIWSAGRGTRG